MEKKQTPKKVGTINPILSPSAARGYGSPTVKATTEIKADDPKYNPQEVNGLNVIKTKQNISMPHRASVVVDCGFNYKISPQWKIIVDILPSWAERGLIVSNCNAYEVEGRMRIYVTNVGKQIITLQEGDEIAHMVVEPRYMFEWVHL